MDRNEILNRVRTRSKPWDIIVIGGGATGMGCAVDAATRGYDVLLLEQHDFGKGTSSRSTKLVHGGVRYLRQGNISLVREALKERAILLENAPHVAHSRSFIVPCYGMWQKAFYGIGLKIYDLLAGKHSLGRSRILSRDETMEQLPSIVRNGLSGGVLYYDGQFDDTRLLIDLMATADKYGAAVLNYTRVNSVVKNDDGRVTGVEFTDAETGKTFHVSANTVINAAGVFCDTVRAMSEGSAKPIITFSQGIHLVFDRKFLPGDSAVMIPKTRDGRVLFCIPWHGRTLVGTTDTPVETAELEPVALETEIDFVLQTVGKYLAEAPARNDILSVFAGIRPLVRSRHATKTSTLSRGHDLFVDDSGLITITGGKWTTYRRMAEDAVNKAATVGKLKSAQCVTATLSIESTVTDSGQPLHPGLPYTTADITRAARSEMARTVEDVLARRTRILFLDARAAIELAPQIAKIMAVELGKEQQWCSAEVEKFNQLAKQYLPRRSD